MQYLELIKNEKILCSTIAGRAQLMDMIWYIVDYVKEHGKLPPDSIRNHIYRNMNVRRSKIDETVTALDNLARKRYYARLCTNPFDNLIF